MWISPNCPYDFERLKLCFNMATMDKKFSTIYQHFIHNLSTIQQSYPHNCQKRQEKCPPSRWADFFVKSWRNFNLMKKTNLNYNIAYIWWLVKIEKRTATRGKRCAGLKCWSNNLPI